MRDSFFVAFCITILILGNFGADQGIPFFQNIHERILGATCTNNFPTSLNSYAQGNCIPSAWANALEAKLGVNGSGVTSSIDWLIKASTSTLSHLHATTSITGYGEFITMTSTATSTFQANVFFGNRLALSSTSDYMYFGAGDTNIVTAGGNSFISLTNSQVELQASTTMTIDARTAIFLQYAGTNIMRVASGSDSWLSANGNFGIGTQLPSSSLHVFKSGSSTLMIGASSSVGAGCLILPAASGTLGTKVYVYTDSAGLLFSTTTKLTNCQ